MARYPVLYRFPPFPDAVGSLDSEAVIIGTVPSGYAQVLDGVGASSPLLPSTNPANGAYIYGAALAGSVLGAADEYGYLKATIPDGRIGRFAIGRSPIGWRRPLHNAISPGAAPGLGETEATHG